MEINGLNFAKLDLDGGGGGDELTLKTADPLIGITEEAISLNFAKIEYTEYKELSVIGERDRLQGGDQRLPLRQVRSMVVVAATSSADHRFAGGAVDRRQVLVDRHRTEAIGEINYAGLRRSAISATKPPARWRSTGSTSAKLELAGGGGGDTLKLTTGDGLIGITEAAISLNFSKIEIDYKEFCELKLIGGEMDSKIEIADFMAFVKLFSTVVVASTTSSSAPVNRC